MVPSDQVILKLNEPVFPPMVIVPEVPEKKFPVTITLVGEKGESMGASDSGMLLRVKVPLPFSAAMKLHSP